MNVVGGPDLSTAALLVRAFAPPALPISPSPVPLGTRCALTGVPLTRGYRASALTTSATAEFLDSFRGGAGGWVSENAARCYRAAAPGSPFFRSLLAFEDGTGLLPLIRRADAERGAWSDIVRAVWPARRGQRLAAILTTDTKRRLWPAARVGVLGVRTPLLVHDAATSQHAVVTLDWPALIACLDAVEEAYEAGYSKRAIREGLLCDPYAVQEWAAVREMEAALKPWRARPEFAAAVLIAQRTAPNEEMP